MWTNILFLGIQDVELFNKLAKAAPDKNAYAKLIFLGSK
jgi:hypothetical protein